MKRLLCIATCLLLFASAVPALAGKREAWKFLEFDGQGHAEERELVLLLNLAQKWGLVEQADLDAPDRRPDVFIALEDMDGDGEPEIFAMFTGPFYCGTGGCPFQLLRRGPDGNWRIIWDHISGDPEGMAVGPLRNGLREVLFAGGGPHSGDDPSCPVWGYTGKRYDLISRMPHSRRPCREAVARHANGIGSLTPVTRP